MSFKSFFQLLMQEVQIPVSSQHDPIPIEQFIPDLNSRIRCSRCSIFTSEEAGCGRNRVRMEAVYIALMGL